MAALTAYGVPKSQMERIFPSTAASIDEDSRALYQKLQLVVAKDPTRKLTLLGHSKGGAALLAMALKHPDFVNAHVASLTLIQPSIWGSPLVPALLFPESPNLDGMPWVDKLVFFGMRAVVRSTRRWFARGEISLETRHATRYWEKLLAKHPDAAKQIGNKLFYIRASRAPSKTFNFHRATGLYLTKVGGPNDGSLPETSQSIDGLGTVLGTLDGAHTDFVSDILIPPKVVMDRGKALTQTLLEQLAKKCPLPAMANEAENK